MLCDMRGAGAFRASARTVFASVLILGALWAAGRAEAEEPPHHPVNLSFFYPISTNRDHDVTTNFRLNLIYGDIGAVRGVDLNGVVGRIRGDMVGLQAAGIYSHITGELHGAAVTGIANYVESDARGLQAAGLVNFLRSDFAGLQLAGIFNYVEGDVAGAQATAVFNLNDGDVKYFQYSSVANTVAGDLTGVQLAVGVNFVNGTMTGGQAAVCNFAGFMKGVQVGIGNMAGEAEGVQVGFINVANRLDGVPIGMINYVREGGNSDWVTYASNLAAASTGIRTTFRRLYSVVAIGVGDLQDDLSGTASFSWHYGYAIPVAPRWEIGLDIGYVHLMPQSSTDPEVNTRAHFAVQARAIAEVGFSEKFKLFAGGGVSQRYSSYSSDNTSSTDPLFVLGVSLY